MGYRVQGIWYGVLGVGYLIFFFLLLLFCVAEALWGFHGFANPRGEELVIGWNGLLVILGGGPPTGCQRVGSQRGTFFTVFLVLSPRGSQGFANLQQRYLFSLYILQGVPTGSSILGQRISERNLSERFPTYQRDPLVFPGGIHKDFQRGAGWELVTRFPAGG